MSTKRLAVLLSVLFVVLGGAYLKGVSVGDSPITRGTFLAIAGLLGFIFLMKLLVGGLTGKERVNLTGKGRLPLEFEDPVWARRLREDAAPAREPGSARRKR